MTYPINIIGNLIGACWQVFIIYWFINAFNNKKSVKNKNWRKLSLLRIAVIFLGITAVWIFASFGHETQIIPYTKIIQILGVALCAFGIAWAIWARKTLGTNWSGYVTLKENHELIQTGPYKITRHPIYTGIIIAFLGTFLAAIPTWAGLCMVVFGIIGFYFKLRKEERLMMQTFPEAYPAYKKRVPATVIPLIF